MRRWLVVLLVTSSLISAVVAPVARGDAGRFSLQLHFGGVQPALNDSAQIWLFAPIVGGELQYWIKPQTALALGVRFAQIDNDSINASLLKINNERANRRLSMVGVSLAPKFYLQPRQGAAPFIQPRIEMLIWKVKRRPGNETVSVVDGNGIVTDFSAAEMALGVALGVEKSLGKRIALSAAAEFSHLTGLNADFADWVENSRSRALLQFSAGLAISFGDVKKKSRPEIIGDQDETQNGGKLRDEVKISDPANPPPVTDSDLDGIADDTDQCPSTPAGAKVDVRGCQLDGDNDGVFDGLDECPLTAAEESRFVDGTGCVPDSDFDGIPDYRDRCPYTGENVTVDSTGCVFDMDGDGVGNDLDLCPDTPKIYPVDERGCPDRTQIFVRRLYYSLFNSGESKLRRDKTAALDSIAVLLKAFSDVSATVKGFTDNVGPADANIALSQKRADAVKQYLITQGVPQDRVLSIGRGEADPLASNRTRNGREANRRIEIEFKY